MCRGSSEFGKIQFFVTHTIRQTEIPLQVDSWVTNTISVKNVVSTIFARPYIFVKNIICLSVCLLSVGQDF